MGVDGSPHKEQDHCPPAHGIEQRRLITARFGEPY
jgi:hypothetical protein